jgi:hypothetical protein
LISQLYEFGVIDIKNDSGQYGKVRTIFPIIQADHEQTFLPPRTNVPRTNVPPPTNERSDNIEQTFHEHRTNVPKDTNERSTIIDNIKDNRIDKLIDNDNKEKSEKQVFAHTPERKSKVVNIYYKLPDDFSHELKETFEAFMLYKKQRKETYKSEHSINLLIKKIQDNRVHFSDTLIIEVINMSMENNWAGIFFDKLQKNKEDKKQIAPENPFLKPIKFDLL